MGFCKSCDKFGGGVISKELSVFAWKCQEELWYFCGRHPSPSWPQHHHLHASFDLGLPGQDGEGLISMVSRALPSGWDRLILQVLREGRTRCHLIIPALPACQARTGYMNSPSFQCLFVFFWSRCGKGKLEDGDGINLNDIEKVLPVWQVGAGAVST